MLNADQEKAKANTLSSFDGQVNSDTKYNAIIGTAGTGKTYCVSEILKELSGKKIMGIAPTNTAVKQMRKSLVRSGLSRVESMTCAKALGLLPEVGGNGQLEFVELSRDDDSEFPLEQADILWVDEASMIDKNTLDKLRDRTKSDAKFLFTLDQWQLPPINCKEIPVMGMLQSISELTKTERYAEGSFIYNVISRTLQSVKSKEKGYRLTDYFPQSNDEYRVLSSPLSNRTDGNNPIYMLMRAFLKAEIDGNHQFVRAICWTNEEVRKINTLVRSLLYNGLTEKSDYLPGELLVVTGAVTREEMKAYGNKVMATTKTLYSTATNLIVESSVKTVIASNDGANWDAYELLVYDPDEYGTPKHKVVVLALHERDRYEQQLNQLKKAMSEEYKKSGKSLAWRSLLLKLKGLQEMVDPIRHSYAITAHCSQGMSLNHVFINQSNICSNRYDVDVKNRCLFVGASRAKETIWVF